MPLSGSLYMIHFMFCEFQLNGKKKPENLDEAGREAVEGVLWGENNGVCKNGQASQICTFRELCCLVSEASSGSGKIRISRNPEGFLGPTWVNKQPTPSLSSARDQSSVSFPRWEAMCFRWEGPRPEVAGPPLAQSHPGSLQALPWSLLPLLGACEERPQDQQRTLSTAPQGRWESLPLSAEQVDTESSSIGQSQHRSFKQWRLSGPAQSCSLCLGSDRSLGSSILSPLWPFLSQCLTGFLFCSVPTWFFSLWVEVGGTGIHIPSILGQGAGSVPTHGAPLHDFPSARVRLTSLSVECTKEVKG